MTMIWQKVTLLMRFVFTAKICLDFSIRWCQIETIFLVQVKLADYLTNIFTNLWENDRPLFEYLCQVNDTYWLHPPHNKSEWGFPLTFSGNKLLAEPIRFTEVSCWKGFEEVMCLHDLEPTFCAMYFFTLARVLEQLVWFSWLLWVICVKLIQLWSWRRKVLLVYLGLFIFFVFKMFKM